MHLVRDPLSQADGRAPLTGVRVLGVGSPAGDDRVGWLAIEALLRSDLFAPPRPERVCALALDRPGANLVRYLEGAERVFLIDAMRSGSAPGSILRLEGVPGESSDHALSTHGLGVAAALALARALQALPCALILYTVEIAALAPEAGASAVARRAARAVARSIREELRQAASTRTLEQPLL